MSTLAELEQRVAALEERLEMEGGLRAATDRDLGDMAQTLRAQQHSIQALAITEAQHNSAIREVSGRVDRLTGAVEELRRDHGAKLDQIVTMLGQLIRMEGEQPTT